MSPRKSGPWIIIRKCSNGVNFEIESEKNKTGKIIHHNRLYPYSKFRNAEVIATDLISSGTDMDCSSDSSDASEIVVERRYPLRERRPPVRDGYISWDVVDSDIDGGES